MFETLLPLAAIEWKYILGYDSLEIIATISGIVSIILLARENMLGWPLGIVWAGVSTYLAFTSWQLVSDGILYFTYVPIQLYCWAVWIRNGGKGKEADFIPSWLPAKKQLLLVGSAVVCIGIWALAISALAKVVSWIPTPDLLIRDSSTTVLNFFSQFLMAKKRMENWVGWVIVNMLGIHIYLIKDSPIYAAQYAIFLVLGIYGWREWHKHRKAAAVA